MTRNYAPRRDRSIPDRYDPHAARSGTSVDLGVREERNAAVGERNRYARHSYEATTHSLALGRAPVVQRPRQGVHGAFGDAHGNAPVIEMNRLYFKSIGRRLLCRRARDDNVAPRPSVHTDDRSATVSNR